MLQIWFLDYFSMSISSPSELEWSLMSFAASESTSRSFNLTESRLAYQPLFGKMSPHSFPQRPDTGDGGNRA